MKTNIQNYDKYNIVQSVLLYLSTGIKNKHIQHSTVSDLVIESMQKIGCKQSQKESTSKKWEHTTGYVDKKGFTRFTPHFIAHLCLQTERICNPALYQTKTMEAFNKYIQFAATKRSWANETFSNAIIKMVIPRLTIIYLLLGGGIDKKGYVCTSEEQVTCLDKKYLTSTKFTDWNFLDKYVQLLFEQEVKGSQGPMHDKITDKWRLPSCGFVTISDKTELNTLSNLYTQKIKTLFGLYIHSICGQTYNPYKMIKYLVETNGQKIIKSIRECKHVFIYRMFKEIDLKS